MTDALRHDAEMIVRELRAAGHEAYFAGGCVRDLVMGIGPKDYDIATSARPDAVMAVFRQTRAVGAQCGVVLVHGDAGDCEVATFRADGGKVTVRIYVRESAANVSPLLDVLCLTNDAGYEPNDNLAAEALKQ